MSKVKCVSLEEMAVMIASFVKAGLIFEADTVTMVITLTGGY